jgi:hypothetical protein
MSQNRSHAVMAQRVEAHDSLDDFPTPPFGTRAFCEHVMPLVVTSMGMVSMSSTEIRDEVRRLSVWEPCANRGHMVRPLAEYFGAVHATDVHDYGAGFGVLDFLFPAPPPWRPDLVVTNPPFRLATQIVRRAMSVSRLGCAVLVRGTWMESLERYELFREIPPTLIAQFAERVPMVKGRLDRKASTATAYAWVVFLHGQTDTRWRHIPPCRKALDRDEDWPAPVVADEVAA